jgi:hypothetical protein
VEKNTLVKTIYICFIFLAIVEGKPIKKPPRRISKIDENLSLFGKKGDFARKKPIQPVARPGRG